MAEFLVLATAAFGEGHGQVMGGIYYDNFNHFHARAGYSHYLDDAAADRAHIDSPIIFGELELGQEGQKLTVGYGHAEYAGGMGSNVRFGISAAELNNQAYLGVESVLSILIVAFKLGAYRNLDTEENEVLLGVGLGL